MGRTANIFILEDDDLVSGVLVRVASYEWKNRDAIGKNQTGTQRGFIAQEVEKVFPKWVTEDEKGTKVLTIPPDQFFALMVESLRAEHAENEALKKRVDAMEFARRPVVNGNWGFLSAGLVIGGAVFMSRRKRSETDQA